MTQLPAPQFDSTTFWPYYYYYYPQVQLTPVVTYELVSPHAMVPQRQTLQSAGFDCSACLLDEGDVLRVVQFRDERNRPYELKALEAHGQVSAALPAGHRALIPLGFKATLPGGYVAQLSVRSSLAWKQGLVVANAPGIIDADFPGEWMAVIQNTGREPVAVVHGERLCQLVIQPYTAPYWVPGVVGETTDRTGGLGSTGV